MIIGIYTEQKAFGIQIAQPRKAVSDMDEYIKRKDAISAICFGCNQEFSDEPCEPKECYISRAISNTPTADVVPKSEVKALKNQVNRLQMYAAKRDEKLNALLVAKTKQEVARKIFEEIYETMNSVYASVQRSCVGMHGDNPETMRLLGKLEGVKRLGDEIAELKKKHTESEGET